jgi:hypothetical protein
MKYHISVSIQWLMYWPDWWKLWPFYSTIFDVDFNQKMHFAGFGPFQCRWRTSHEATSED